VLETKGALAFARGLFSLVILVAMRRAAWVIGAAWLAACGGRDHGAAEQGDDGSGDGSTSHAGDTSTDAEATSVADTSGGEGSDTGAAAGPTWAHDVAPILAAHCWSCHVDGGFAPFSLVDYDDAQPIAAGIAAISAAREMPPWPIDGTGACQSYDDARWLGDDELATLAAWADAGAPPGDLAAAPQPPSPPTLGEVASTIALPPYTPVAEPPEHPFDDYRCFVVDTGLPQGGLMTAFEVRPGVVEQAHHIVMFSLEDDAAVQQALALQDQDAEPGYRCFGSAGVGNSRIVGAWTPGVPVVRYPEGTGVALDPGRPIVVQMHYNFGSSGMLDETAIDVQLGEGTPLLPVIFVDSELSIPPDVGDHVEESVTSFDGDAPVELVAVFPHMHQIGRTMHVEIESAGGTTCAADVPRYDFHWQELYRYTTPVSLQPGDQVRLQCHFSSLGRDGTTTWGEGSGDEMCAVVFFARTGS
jgi:hypothetical protein